MIKFVSVVLMILTPLSFGVVMVILLDLINSNKKDKLSDR